MLITACWSWGSSPPCSSSVTFWAPEYTIAAKTEPGNARTTTTTRSKNLFITLSSYYHMVQFTRLPVQHNLNGQALAGRLVGHPDDLLRANVISFQY